MTIVGGTPEERCRSERDQLPEPQRSKRSTPEAEIQGVPTDMSDLYMGLGQDEITKTGPSPQECVEQPGKDPRANESGSKGCRKIARGASARAARHIHPIPAKQYDGVAPSISPTRADSSLEHADRGSVLKGRTRERMSYAESARGKLPFQLP
jgi:hypothetical protein